MSWSYLPLTEEEGQKARYSLLDDGVYDARVDKIETKLSSKGNPMIVLDLIVFDHQGEGHSIKDFLVSTKQMMWKLKHCCDSAGLSKEYMDGIFQPHMLEQRNLRVKIGLQIGSRIPDDKLNGKAPGAMYPDRNVCDDYETDKTGFESLSKVVKKEDSPFIDDETIPF